MKKKILGLAIVALMLIGCFNAVGTNTDVQNDCGCNQKEGEAKSYPKGFVVPDNWEDYARPNYIFATSFLPTSFDWRSEAGGFIPVGDQTLWCLVVPVGCGSCWAFATCGVFECLIRIRDGKKVDLSEQYLISCNKEGWGCDGGFVAHDYHYDVAGKCNNDPGAVYAGHFPYQLGPWCAQPDEVPCETHTHPYKLDGWADIYPRTNGIPSIENIQRSIYEHGPVYCALHAGEAFENYYSGVFKTNEAGNPNHAVVIVGWNGAADDPNGYWIIRNSWGSDWGENGYMRIRYGTSKIGYDANYAMYKDPEQDLECSGDLKWGEVPAGSTLKRNLIIKNTGEYRSFLDWEISSHPKWGTWTFEPDEGGGIGQNGEQLVEVKIKLPSEDPKTYDGSVRIVNLEDSSDYVDVEVKIQTSRARNKNMLLLMNLLESFPLLKILYSNFLL